MRGKFKPPKPPALEKKKEEEMDEFEVKGKRNARVGVYSCTGG
jgi:hypothetical protein